MKKILFTIALLVSFASFGQITEELVQTIDEFYDKGRNKMGNSDYYGAIADYTRIIKIYPVEAEPETAYYNRGLCKMALKDFYGALSDYTRVIEINPNDAVAYVNRGYCKMHLNDNVSACQDFRKAQEYGYDASDLTTKTCY